MTPQFRIATARPFDVPFFASIEREAAQLLRGYAPKMLAEDLPHLDEIDVHPDHGRRGAGTALVRAVCEWTRRSGYSGITLTTFRGVPWNMPFYSRLGFEDVSHDKHRPELKAVVADETARGLDPRHRVIMRYRVRAA